MLTSKMVNSFNNDFINLLVGMQINNNIMLSNEWRRVIETPVDFLSVGWMQL